MFLHEILSHDSLWIQSALLGAFAVYIVGMNLLILFDEKPAQSTMAWLLTVNLLPFLGLPIYLLAGVNWRRFGIVHQRPEEILQRYLHGTGPEPLLDAHIPEARKAVRMLHKSNGSRLTVSNRVEFYYDGASLFKDLKADLWAAKDFIHIEFFIWRSDALGEDLAEILKAKAREGVKVRILVDRIGSFGRISYRYRRELKQAGVEFHYFMSINPATALLSNYLNHRKIVVIDRTISYTGGMNVGMEYIDGGSCFPAWRDTHLRLVGEASSQLQAIFVTDWYNTTRKWLDTEKDYFQDWDTQLDAGDLAVQIACSGPDSDWATIKNLYFNLITNAQDRILIQSPYFIPDEMMLSALTLAALSGVEVHLMMTGLPDKRIPFWAAYTYIETLLQAGGYVYHYNAGFLHSKVMICDDNLASVGSCNLDIRAFELDYEVNAMFYSAEVVRALTAQFEQDLLGCRRLTLEELQQQGKLIHLRNKVLRLLSPLL